LADGPDFYMSNILVTVILDDLSICLPFVFGHLDALEKAMPKALEVVNNSLPVQVVLVVAEEMKPIENSQINSVVEHVYPEVLRRVLRVFCERTVIRKLPGKISAF